MKKIILGMLITLFVICASAVAGIEIYERKLAAEELAMKQHLQKEIFKAQQIQE